MRKQHETPTMPRFVIEARHLAAKARAARMARKYMPALHASDTG
jgi:hypothetical protein